jgi:antitoxin HicB
MKYVYPAVFTAEPEGSYGVLFPDLPGCVTCGDNLADAIDMGRDALVMWICDAEDKNEIIPKPSKLTEILYDKKASFINLIDADTNAYRQQNDNRSVKKTLTLPAWLNIKAEKAGVNFSQILQEALKKHLNIEGR